MCYGGREGEGTVWVVVRALVMEGKCGCEWEGGEILEFGSRFRRKWRLIGLVNGLWVTT